MPLSNPTTPAIGVANGTVFPVSPVTNDRFLRTDRHILYYYDGTRWLSETEYTQPLVPYSAIWVTAISATQSHGVSACPYSASGKSYITRFTRTGVAAATNDATHYWTFDLKDAAAGIIATLSTQSESPGTTHEDVAVASERTHANDKIWYVTATPTTGGSAPGNYSAYSYAVSYRLVG